ncbi:hypothetical protein NL676_010784 [Syzygium grande]|nr:hypothetical protein NL676_010784 [Syzygium grande]
MDWDPLVTFALDGKVINPKDPPEDPIPKSKPMEPNPESEPEQSELDKELELKEEPLKDDDMVEPETPSGYHEDE